MNRENAKLILDGNAFYEIDLACLRAKENQKIHDRTAGSQKSQAAGKKSVQNK